MSAARCSCGRPLGVVRVVVLDLKRREVTICPTCWSGLRPSDQIEARVAR